MTDHQIVTMMLALWAAGLAGCIAALVVDYRRCYEVRILRIMRRRHGR